MSDSPHVPAPPSGPGSPRPRPPDARGAVIGWTAFGLVVALIGVTMVVVSAWFGWMMLTSLRWDSSPDGGAASTRGKPVVTKVVDGDTIEVRAGGHTEKVRLLGIDTPETKDPRKPVQCFGKEASQHTTELLPVGTEVRLEPDVEERDRYDRVLAYVYRVEDGLFVNLELARAGYADLLTYPPNVAHTAEFQAAVSEARREQRGLWQACGGPGRPA
jgi:micrococcal nuclease